MADSVPVLVLKDIRHGYEVGRERVDVLKGVNLTLNAGEMVALLAPSGSGKSTLLHIAGLLEKPQQGTIEIVGKNASVKDDSLRTRLRGEMVGFVYQSHRLLPEFDALENVRLPLEIMGVSRREAEERAADLLQRFGLKDRLKHRPAELSGGQQQRVAIARALAVRPRLILADEPTGNLDPQTSQNVFEELMRLIREEGVSALIATHNEVLARQMSRRLTLKEGQIHPLP